MGKKAGIVDVFATPYEVWTKRDTTSEEAVKLVNETGVSLIAALSVKDKLIEVISTHAQAATRLLREHVDNGLEDHIDRALDESVEYRELRNLMPPTVPKALASYQSEHPEHDEPSTDAAIKAYGVEMAEGQVLFHGGLWAGEAGDCSTLTTSRPFSTSFCPQVALRDAGRGGMAFDAGRVDLMVVRVTQPNTKAYAYSRQGEHGNEKEVVFASGAKLTRVSEIRIADIPVGKVTSGYRVEEKIVPTYLVEVEIS